MSWLFGFYIGIAVLTLFAQIESSCSFSGAMAMTLFWPVWALRALWRGFWEIWRTG